MQRVQKQRGRGWLGILTSVGFLLAAGMLEVATDAGTSLIDTLQGQLDKRVARMNVIVETAASEDRATFTEAEDAEYKQLRADITALQERIGDLKDQESREQSAASAAVAMGDGGIETGTRGARIHVGAEERTYSAQAARRDKVSFLRDLMHQGSDPDARDRLQRHSREQWDHELAEYRDVGTGQFAGLTVPQYLTDLVAPFRRAGRVVADLCTQRPLPPDGMTLTISRITTGSAVGAQAAEHGASTETDMDDTALNVNVRTYTGMQDVSRQAVDRSVGVEDIVVGDLVAAYNTKLDADIIMADGTSGTHLGINSTGGIISVTYTSATPTAAELYPKLFDLVQQIQSGVFSGMDALVMHPRRWWWIASQVSTSHPFIQAFNINIADAAGQVQSFAYGSGPSGIVAGLPVYVDANVPTNVGGAQDLVFGITRSELHLWEDPSAPLFIRSEEVLGNQLAVRFVLYGYSAFTAGRVPAANGKITGTGLVTPTF